MAVRDKKKQTETGFITAGDRYLFGEGTHYEIYNKLGAHPKTFDGKDGYYFAVWAPHAASVSVVGDFNNWDPDACPNAGVGNLRHLRALYSRHQTG